MNCYGVITKELGTRQEFVIYADSRENCLRGAVDHLINYGEKICILKAHHSGNSHDDCWEDWYQIVDGDVWEDKLDEAKEKAVHGWYDVSLERVNELSDCLNNWATNEWFDLGYEIYTLNYECLSKKSFRYRYSLDIRYAFEKSFDKEAGSDMHMKHTKLFYCWVYRDLSETVEDH